MQAAPSGVACCIYISLPNDSTICFMKKGTFIMLLGSFAAMNAAAANVGTTTADSSLSAIPVPEIQEITIEESVEYLPVETVDIATATIDTAAIYDFSRTYASKGQNPSIYVLPYSLKTNSPDWKKLWINTGVLAGAFGGTLLVLQCLPQDATSWNRAELQQEPPLKRWYRNVFVRDPEIDHDKFIFNYVLHPYAGAVYFMAARTAGFNFWRSFLYCSIVSDIGWEFGVEACMERPSYQDLVITPVVGSIIGECFYKLKRHIVNNDYRLFGSKVVGNIAAFIVDPVNGFTDLFSHSNTRGIYRPARKATAPTSSLMPSIVNGAPGFTFNCVF